MIRVDIVNRIVKHTDFFGHPPTDLYLNSHDYNELVEGTADTVDRVVYPDGHITLFGLEVNFIPRGDAYVSDH